MPRFRGQGLKRTARAEIKVRSTSDSLPNELNFDRFSLDVYW